MPSLADIRAGLKTRLDTIADVQASAYRLENPTPPTIQVTGPEEVEYDTTFGRGGDEWTLLVQAFVAYPSDIGAQKKLDAMLAPTGAGSVKAAIEADATLGGVADWARVTRCSGYQLYTLRNGVEVLGADWSVQVHTSN